MNATDYIKGKLDALLERFSGISVRYAFEKISNYHIVEIEPLEELKKNEEFLDFVMKFWFEFDDTFEYENLLISERDEVLNDMSNLLYEHSLNRQLNVSAIEKFNIESLQIHFDCNIFDSQFLAA